MSIRVNKKKAPIAPLQITTLVYNRTGRKLQFPKAKNQLTDTIMSVVEYSIQYLASGQGFIFDRTYGKVSEKLGWTKAKFNLVFRYGTVTKVSSSGKPSSHITQVT